MNTTQRNGILQRWNIIQYELRNEVGALTPKLLKLVHILEWVRIEGFVMSSGGGCGRPEHDRGMLANAFVAKAVLGIPMTAARVTNGYDLMDAAYCSRVVREHSRSLGHVPLIDHNPRKGQKIAFTPSEAQSGRAHQCPIEG